LLEVEETTGGEVLVVDEGDEEDEVE